MSKLSIRVLATITASLVCAMAIAQDADTVATDNPELTDARAALQAGRDQIIRDDLQLTQEEAAGFWPVYQKYIADLAAIRERKGILVARFMQAYEDGEFTDQFAEWLIAENFAIKDAWTGIQKTYVPRFSVVLPAQKVARFYQLENKMDAEVDAQLALIVPLVE